MVVMIRERKGHNMSNENLYIAGRGASRAFALGTRLLFGGLVFAGVLSAQNAPNMDKKEAAPPSAPAPKHDLSGVWMMRNPPAMRAYTGATFTKEEPELTDWGKQKYAEAKNSNNGKFTLATTNDPVLTNCAPPGTPRVYFHPYPLEFVHTPKLTLLLYEYDHTIRRIYTDGRPIPADPDLTWMGTSVGRWENDTTLVVDTVGLNDKTWLDRLGHAHSTALHVTERFRRVDMDHMQIDFKMEDPKALAKPWTATFYYELRPKWEMGEISCSGDYLDFSKFEK
jgi:hypothetical protein